HVTGKPMPDPFTLLDPHPGNNPPEYEAWALAGLGVNTLWASLLGGMIEFAGKFNSLWADAFLGNRSFIMRKIFVALSSAITTGAISILNIPIVPFISNFMSVISYDKNSRIPAVETYWREWVNDTLLEILNAGIATVGAAVTSPILDSFGASLTIMAFKGIYESFIRVPGVVVDHVSP
ncbi:MAG: hypothetical protein KC708_23395, partial [Anaerolineae bacterium]|nr:hypothetical protein [Anaerolineae bacterium]